MDYIRVLKATNIFTFSFPFTVAIVCLRVHVFFSAQRLLEVSAQTIYLSIIGKESCKSF